MKTERDVHNVAINSQMEQCRITVSVVYENLIAPTASLIIVAGARTVYKDMFSIFKDRVKVGGRVKNICVLRIRKEAPKCDPILELRKSQPMSAIAIIKFENTHVYREGNYENY